LLSDHWHGVNWLALVPSAGLLIGLDLGNDGWLKILLERNLEELRRGQLIRGGQTGSRKEEGGLHQLVLIRVVVINRARRKGMLADVPSARSVRRHTPWLPLQPASSATLEVL
jgi:hypothetical protein